MRGGRSSTCGVATKSNQYRGSLAAFAALDLITDLLITDYFCATIRRVCASLVTVPAGVPQSGNSHVSDVTRGPKSSLLYAPISLKPAFL
jgi:hypothetical protein